MRVPEVVTRGWPVRVEMAATLPGAPEVVWELITDWRHGDDWMLEARDFVVLSDRKEGVGVVAEATVTIGGITTRDEIEVVRWEPSRYIVIEHKGWVTGMGGFRLTPLGSDRTHVVWTEELRAPLGALGAVGMTVFKPLMRRVFLRDLRVLESLVRARS